MAIHTKVGILTQEPGSSTPGLIDGIYAEFITKALDFLDDLRTYPQREWFTSDPMSYVGMGDWEDVATTYRAWRDQYNKAAYDYWESRYRRTPFSYSRYAIDPAPYGDGSNPIDWVRGTNPAKNGDFIFPFPNPTGIEHYSFHNPASPSIRRRARLSMSTVAEFGFMASMANDSAYYIEEQGQIRDNQAAVDAKQAQYSILDSEYLASMAYSNISASFSVGSGIEGNVSKAVMLADGKFLFAGAFNTAFEVDTRISTDSGLMSAKLIRINADMTVDTTFNALSQGNIRSIDVDADGKILVAGTYLTGYDSNVNIIRINSDGSIDSTFAPLYFESSIQSADIYCIKYNSGKILAGGIFDSCNGSASSSAIISINSDGTIDDAFEIGTGLTGTYPFVNSINIQADGKIILGGQFEADQNGQISHSIIRLNSDGSTDSSFDAGTGFYFGTPEGISQSSSIAIQADGKILVGGGFNMFNGATCSQIVRLNSDGSLDSQFQPPIIQGNFGDESACVLSIAIQADGRIIVGGAFQSIGNIARLNADGSLDTYFNCGNGFNNPVTYIPMLESDIIAFGPFTWYNGYSYNGHVMGIKLEDSQYRMASIVIGERDAAGSELDALMNASIWIWPDTKSNRLTMHRYNRESYFKCLGELADGIPLSEQTVNIYGLNGELLETRDSQNPLTEQELAQMKQALLDFDYDANIPSLWHDEACRPIWADYSLTPVSATNHPSGTMPFEVLPGVTSINTLPAVANSSLLPATGNPGDIVRNTGSGEWHAWDPQNQEWSAGFYARFLDPFVGPNRDAKKDAKLKSYNEMELAMKPFTFSSLHIPAFSITTDGSQLKQFGA